VVAFGGGGGKWPYKRYRFDVSSASRKATSVIRGTGLMSLLPQERPLLL